MNWWQHLPGQIDPIVFTVGFLSLRWYALMWLAGLALAWFMARRLASSLLLPAESWFDLFFSLFLGAWLGGRIGFALWYRPDWFLAHPMSIILPFASDGSWTGISGMSFHGGLLGVVAALYWFSRRHRLNFLLLADIVALVAPLALFSGRIGNFLNLELYGRVTSVPWGMYFPGVIPSTLRHPSTLYEALLEGVLLFAVLFIVRSRIHLAGGLSALFLVIYGILRFLVEYVREPDRGVVLLYGVLTRGQALSLVMIASGALLFLWLRRQNHDRIEGH